MTVENDSEKTEPVKILSWDVGIKNLAYCEIEKYNNEFKILNWGIINLVDDRQKCQFELRTGTQCSESAKFLIYHKDKIKLFEQFENGCFCVCPKHKDKMIPEIIPIEYESPKKKKKNTEPIPIHNCIICDKKATFKLTHTNYCWCDEHHEKKAKSFVKKIGTKKITLVKCSRQPLQELGEKLYTRLDSCFPSFLQVSEVLIENQPSFRNPNMKTIATILFSYFIMRGIIDRKNTKSIIEEVRFVSPSNKLKIDIKNTNRVLVKGQKKAVEYKLTKKLGIKYCKVLIDENDNSILDKYKKKDDMCDAFLQGFQYLFNPVPKKYFDKLQTIGFDDTKKKSKKNDTD